MAEWSKAPDSRYNLARYSEYEASGPCIWAWVQIPLLTFIFFFPFCCIITYFHHYLFSGGDTVVLINRQTLSGKKKMIMSDCILTDRNTHRNSCCLLVERGCHYALIKPVRLPRYQLLRRQHMSHTLESLNPVGFLPNSKYCQV